MKESGPRKFISYIRCTCQEEVDEHKYAKKSLEKMAVARPFLEDSPSNVKPSVVKSDGGFNVWG